MTACFLGASHLLMDDAEAAPCSIRLVSVVAHLDDDLLFINPEIIDAFDKGGCTTTVHVIGGGGGTDMDTVCYREEGLRKAYARMANVPNIWTSANVQFAGKFVTQMTLDANPKVTFLELRLQGGSPRGGSPLQNLWEFKVDTMTSQSGTAGQPRFANCEKGVANTYTRDELKATLLGILQDRKATRLSTLNPDTTPWLEHPDHIYAARLTRQAAKLLSKNIRINYYETYPTASRPPTILGEKLLRKRDIAATYFSFAPEFGIYTEHHWNGNWVPRSYKWTGHVHDDSPDWQPRAFELANVLTTQCLTSAGLNLAPSVAACTGTSAQQWAYRPNGVAAGSVGNVQLVSSSNNCIEYGGTGFLEVPCSATANQYWSPWDFGIVRAPGWQGFDGDGPPSTSLPGNSCLSVESGSVLTVSSTCNSAASRWAPTGDSTFHDLRQENALVDDFTGDGNADILIVQRPGGLGQFDPGFNVLLKDQATGTTSVWYQSSVMVPWNVVDASPPAGVVVGDHPCAIGGLCFDSSRFLSGDFDGDGKADLMIASPYQNGTAFWLLASDGAKFNAPVLWKQTSATWSPTSAQQYVSADFTGDGKADVLIAQRRSDRGLDLWVLRSTGQTSADPELWCEATNMSASANLKPAKLHAGDLRSDLLAFENGSPTLRIRQILNTGSAFTSLGGKKFGPLEYLSSKPVVADVDGDGLSDVIVLHKRSDGADINVWQMLTNNTSLSGPGYLGTINHTAWADQIPYAMRRNSQNPWLAMVSRPNTAYIPSEGGSQTTYYWRLGGVNLYTHPLSSGVFDSAGIDQGSITSPVNSLYFQDILRVERLRK